MGLKEFLIVAMLLPMPVNALGVPSGATEDTDTGGDDPDTGGGSETSSDDGSGDDDSAREEDEATRNPGITLINRSRSGCGGFWVNRPCPIVDQDVLPPGSEGK